MRIGIITGSGTYALAGLEAAAPREVATSFGPALVSEGRLGEADVVHVSRHQEGHRLLSSAVTHQANLAALRDAGAGAILAVTVCGALDPALELGSLVVFDDLHFPSNRLPDGSLCTLHTEPGAPGPRPLGLRPAVQRAPARRAAGVRRRRRPARPRRRLLRARRRPALQHAHGDRARCGTPASPPSARPPAPRPSSRARRGSRTRWPATPPTTPTACPTSRRRSRSSCGSSAQSTGTFARLLEGALPRVDAGALEPVGTHLGFD